MLITYQWLAGTGACQEELDNFRQSFGFLVNEGVEITRHNLDYAIKRELPLIYLIHVLPPLAGTYFDGTGRWETCPCCISTSAQIDALLEYAEVYDRTHIQKPKETEEHGTSA